MPMIDATTGREVVEDGEAVGFSLAFMDAASNRRSFTDAAPPASGSDAYRAIARARASHAARTGYLGDKAPAFTDAMAHAAATHAAATARPMPTADVLTAQTVTSRALHDTALAKRNDALRNAWRS